MEGQICFWFIVLTVAIVSFIVGRYVGRWQYIRWDSTRLRPTQEIRPDDYQKVKVQAEKKVKDLAAFKNLGTHPDQWKVREIKPEDDWDLREELD